MPLSEEEKVLQDLGFTVNPDKQKVLKDLGLDTPSAIEEGGGITPSVQETAPVALPSPDITDMFIEGADELRFEIHKSVMDGAQVLARGEPFNNADRLEAGLLPIQPGALSLPKELLKDVIWLGDKLDRPFNALRVGLWNVSMVSQPTVPKEEREGISGFLRTMIPGIGQAEFMAEAGKSFTSGVADGFTGRERKEVSDLRDMALFGPYGIHKMNAFLDRHPKLKFAKNANDFLTNLFTEAAAEMLLTAGVLTVAKSPVRALTKRAPVLAKGMAKVTPRTYVRIHWDDLVLPPGTFTKRGYSEWVQETIKKNMPPMTPASDIDSALTRIIMRDVPVGETRLIGVGADRVPVSKYWTRVPYKKVSREPFEMVGYRASYPGAVPARRSMHYAIKKEFAQPETPSGVIAKAYNVARKELRLHNPIEVRGVQGDLLDIWAKQGDEQAAALLESVEKLGRPNKEWYIQADNYISTKGSALGHDGVLYVAGDRSEIVTFQMPSISIGHPEIPPRVKVPGLDQPILETTALANRKTELLHRYTAIEDKLKRVIRPGLDDLDTRMTMHESLTIPNQARLDELARQMDSQFLKVEIAQDQLADIAKRIDGVDGQIRQIDSLTHIDPMASSRAIRSKFIDEYIKVGGAGAGTRAEIDNIIRQVSFGKAKTLDELSDTQFDAVFDFLDMSIKDPQSFTRFPKHPNLRQIPVGESWLRPSWMWFERRAATPIYHQVESAHITRIKDLQRYGQQWEEALDILGKGAARDKDMMSRLFWYRNGDTEKYMLEAKARQLTDTQVAKEINLAEVFKEVGDELGEIGIAQGKLTRDAPGVPFRENYITHRFDQAIEAAGLNEWQLRQLMRPYEYKTNTKIDISMFKRRIANKEVGLIDDIDAAFKSMIGYETWNLRMEPALENATELARLTGSDEIIGYTRLWINHAVRGMPTKGEIILEGPADLFARYLLEWPTKRLPKRLRFVTKDRAAKQLLSGTRRMTMAGALGFGNLSPIARNTTQGLQSTAIVGMKHSKWGLQSLFTPNGKALLEHCHVRLGRVPLADFDVTTISRLERLGMRGFTAVDEWPNVAKTFNESLHWLITRDKSKMAKLKEFGNVREWGDHDGFAKALNDAINTGHFRKEVEIANHLVKVTQYSYRNFDMPRAFWGQVSKSLLQFGSWPANYYYSFLPEIARYTMTGVGPMGIKLSRMERLALFRHYFYQTGLYYTGKTMGFDLARHLPPHLKQQFPFIHFGGAFPTRPSPAAQTLQGVVQMGWGWHNEDKRQIAEGWGTARRSITFMPPLMIAKLLRVDKGEKDPLSLIFPLLEEEDFLPEEIKEVEKIKRGIREQIKVPGLPLR